MSPPPNRRQPSLLSRLTYHLYTVHLFTFSDLKTILIPETAFAIFTSLSGPPLLLRSSTTPFSPNNNNTPSVSASTTLTRIPLIVLWIWINLLPFTISNQAQDDAVVEDGENKPWRPIPAGRIGLRRARWLMGVCYLLALFTSRALDALIPCVCLIALGVSYNYLGGADANPLLRNLINAAGFTSFAAGATGVACGGQHASLNPEVAYQWFAIIMAVVASTVQMQDVPDQEGDRRRGRRTVSLVVGDGGARWTVAVPVAFWSVFVPAWWGVGGVGWVVVGGVGVVVAGRVLLKRSKGEDKGTFKLWNVWMMMLYLVPFWKAKGG